MQSGFGAAAHVRLQRFWRTDMCYVCDRLLLSRYEVIAPLVQSLDALGLWLFLLADVPPRSNVIFTFCFLQQ